MPVGGPVIMADLWMEALLGWSALELWARRSRAVYQDFDANYCTLTNKD